VLFPVRSSSLPHATQINDLFGSQQFRSTLPGTVHLLLNSYPFDFGFQPYK
jgi:hypothetical protein